MRMDHCNLSCCYPSTKWMITPHMNSTRVKSKMILGCQQHIGDPCGDPCSLLYSKYINDEMLSEICVCGKVYFMLKCSILSTCTPLLVCLNCRYPIYIQYSYSTVFNTFTVGNIVYCVLIYICRPLLKRFTKSHA